MVSPTAAMAVLVLLLAGSSSATAARRVMLQSARAASTGGSSQDKIVSFRQLPVGPKLTSQFYSGYVTADASKNQKMFYVFGEAETSPKDAPVIFWMNGGPGCSSVGLNFVKGSGPFIPVSNSTMLLSNPNSFTKFASVLWLDQPLFTGFSISSDEADRATDDTKTAQAMLRFLLSWYERFPQFKANKLFLAGQSYAGHYGPMLSKAILDYNEATRKAGQQDSKKQAMTINLAGLVMGNAWTDPFHDNSATLDFWYDNSLISRDIFEGLQKCDMKTGALWRTDGPSGFNAECEKLRDKALAQIGDIDQYGLNAPICVPQSNAAQATAKYPARDYAFGYGWQLLDPCAAKVLPKFMNNREVQLALGAIQPSEETRQWKACNGQGIKYSIKDLTTSMVPVYKELVSRGLPVLFTSGETDAYVPLEGSRAWIESLDLPLADPAVPIRQWKDTHTQQVGGSVVEYKGLTRVSVRFAGHSLSAWQPYANRQIVQTFVEGGKLPKYPSAASSGARRL